MAIDLIADLRRPGRAVQPLHRVHQVVLAYHPGEIVDLGRADKAGMAVRELLGPVLVDLLHAAGVVAPAMVVAAAEPAFVVAHAVVDHLRMDLEQVEVDERRVVLAAADLGFDSVAPAGPVEVVGSLAEQRAAVRVAHELEQLAVALDLR